MIGAIIYATFFFFFCKLFYDHILEINHIPMSSVHYVHKRKLKGVSFHFKF